MPSKKVNRSILYIVPSDYDQLKAKGVIDMITSRDENGFFNDVVTLHPFAKKENVINLKEGNVIYQFSLGSGLKLFRAAILIFKLLIVFPISVRNKRFSMIRAQDPFLAGLLGVFFKLFFRVPLVISIHSDYDLHGNSHYVLGSKRLTNVLRGVCYYMSDRILPIRRNQIQTQVPKAFHDKVKIFPHYIDDCVFKVNPINLCDKYHIPNKSFKLCFVGRLAVENRVMDLIEAIYDLKTNNLNVHLIICGDGTERIKLEEKVKQLNLSPCISFLGFIPKIESYAIRKSCDAAVNLVGGLSLLESAACQLPLIAYDMDWHNEVVLNDRSGYLIQPGDIAELVKKITQLCSDAELKAQLGLTARKIIESNFTSEKIVKARQDLYREIACEYS